MAFENNRSLRAFAHILLEASTLDAGAIFHSHSIGSEKKYQGLSLLFFFCVKEIAVGSLGCALEVLLKSEIF